MDWVSHNDKFIISNENSLVLQKIDVIVQRYIIVETVESNSSVLQKEKLSNKPDFSEVTNDQQGITKHLHLPIGC